MLKAEHPNLWLLTGLYVIEDGVTWSHSGRSSNIGGTAYAPVIDPTLVSTLLKINPGGNIKIGSTTLEQTQTQILGRKVWAARYQKIGASFVTHVENAEVLPKRLRLLNILSAQRGRGEENEVDLSLDQPSPPALNEAAGEYDDAYWKEFENDAREIDQKLDNTK